MVLGGKVRAAVRMVTNRDVSGAYWPFDTDSKSGRPVIDVLREKHPDTRVPLESDFDDHPGAPDCLESMPVYCYEECVTKAAACLSGSAGLCGVEAVISLLTDRRIYEYTNLSAKFCCLKMTNLFIRGKRSGFFCFFYKYTLQND